MHWRRIVADAAARGPVYLWGAGSKGVTFSLLIDPDGDALAGAVDINPVKQGCFLPLTAVPGRFGQVLIWSGFGTRCGRSGQRVGWRALGLRR